jgi:LPS export ABC transporter permease LptG/LPS export ABC transporter permease LptF
VRILRRYILNEVISHALIGGALFTFILFMRPLTDILGVIVRESASLASMGEIFLFTLPNTFTMTIPMAVLVGVLLGLSRMAADSEITAMRAAGIGVWRFVGIVSLVAIFGWAISLLNSLYLAPKAAEALLELENALKTSQASFEVQPRVFYEDFKNYVLYVQNVRGSVGASQWQHVFLADLTNPASPLIITAAQATVVNSGNGELTMRLRNGTRHEFAANDPNQYSISTFTEADLPLETGNQEDTHISHADAPVLAMSTPELYREAIDTGAKARWYRIEFYKRLAFPASCLVLMLVGVPLGLSSRRGGKSAGFVITIALVFVYYFFSITGVSLARQGKVSAFLGVWAANIIFAAFGLLLLRLLSRGGVANLSISFSAIRAAGTVPRPRLPRLETALRRERSGRRSFPLILDDYVLREFIGIFIMVLCSFVLLMLVFTFFERLGDIIRNRTPLVTVGAYLFNLIPSMVYSLLPLGVLVAVLVTFGVMNRSSELTAMKATGISIYRVIVPVLLIAAILAVGLFLFDESYLPAANRRQEALLSVIKGKPAQTFLRPDQKWIFGEQEPGKPGRIYYYQFFDPDHDRFANISIFEFDPDTFSLTRRIFADTAHWDPHLKQWIFEDGWNRHFQGEAISSYDRFSLSTFATLTEQPSYFKKENRQSSEMSFIELSRYIHDLRQSGFDTMRLRVQLDHKIAYPLITLIMAVLAVPFALSISKRGSLAGVAAAIAVAIVYWVVAGTFEAMGNVNMLPAFLAAWSPDLLFGLAGGYLLLKTPT